MTRARLVRWIALAAISAVTIASLHSWASAAQRSRDRDRVVRPAAVASAQSTSTEETAGQTEGPAPFNFVDFAAKTPPFVAVLLNFAILVGAYYWVGRKPTAAALQNRRDSIAKEIDEAQRAKAAAEERAKVYQAKLEKLQDDVRAAREALVRAGEAERERIVSEAQAKAERLKNDAHFLVEQELKQVKEDLLREAVEAAVAGAAQILASSVTPEDQERLAEEYVAGLGAQKSAPEEPRAPEAAS